MKTLQEYTDEELRTELKRRQLEKMRNAPRKPTEYIEFTGVVTEIDNVQFRYIGGGCRYKAFNLWQYKLQDFVTLQGRIPEDWYRNTPTFKAHASFRKSNAPQIGDTVKLKVRATKHGGYWNFKNAKIIEVINNTK